MSWQKTTNIIIALLVAACAILALLSGENRESVTMHSPGTIGSDSLISFKITGKIDPKKLADSFSITPRTDFVVDISSDLINLIPKTSLVPGEVYTIKFNGQLLGTLDKVQEVEQEFRVTVREPRIAVREQFEDDMTGLTLFDLNGSRLKTLGKDLGNLVSFAFSPEANEVVCSFSKEPMPQGFDIQEFNPDTQVHIISTENGKGRKLGLPEGFCYKNLAWSPKSKAIFALQTKGNSNKIVVFDTQDNFNTLFEDENFVLGSSTPLLFSKDSTILVWFDISKKSFTALNLASYKITTHPFGQIPSRFSLSPSGDFLLASETNSDTLYGVFIGPTINQAGKPVIGVNGEVGRHPYAGSDGINAVWSQNNAIVIKNMVNFEPRESLLDEVPLYPIISADTGSIIYISQENRAKIIDFSAKETIDLCEVVSDSLGLGATFVP